MHYEKKKKKNGANYAKEVNSITIKQAYLAGLDYKNKENAELKEENKFLKEQCLILADRNVCSYTCSEIKKQQKKKKKIIRNCLNLWNNVMTEETIRALIKEAEQFIKEVEK